MLISRSAIATLVGLGVGITCTLGIAASLPDNDQSVTPESAPSSTAPSVSETVEPTSAPVPLPMPVLAPEVIQSLPTPQATPEPVVTDNPVGIGTPVYVEAPEHIEEDDPRWDCRFDGNQRCGVVISGVTYVIQFIDSSPSTVGYPSNY